MVSFQLPIQSRGLTIDVCIHRKRIKPLPGGFTRIRMLAAIKTRAGTASQRTRSVLLGREWLDPLTPREVVSLLLAWYRVCVDVFFNLSIGIALKWRLLPRRSWCLLTLRIQRASTHCHLVCPPQNTSPMPARSKSSALPITQPAERDPRLCSTGTSPAPVYAGTIHKRALHNGSLSQHQSLLTQKRTSEKEGNSGQAGESSKLQAQALSAHHHPQNSQSPSTI
jgi:hypothetical protein